MMKEILQQPLCPWMAGDGPDADIVLSSRVRLARNLAEIPFPNRADAAQLADVRDRIKASMENICLLGDILYQWIEMEQLTTVERCVLVEKHIVSPDHIQEPTNRALIVREDAAVSVMINEEDHLRLQSLRSGLDLGNALQLVNAVDDCLESGNTFAFSPGLGYLTSCPTNLGTGLRASVMVHLPALVLTRQISRIVTAATQLGLAVRGLYGEGTEAIGNIFQISNQFTLGYNELEIVDNLQSVARQIVEQERSAREVLLNNSHDVLVDRVWRAYGILRYARIVSGKEALAMLSEVRLGTDLKIIEDIAPEIFNELLVATRPNFLQQFSKQPNLNQEKRDQLRATVIREKLQGGKEHV